jgi:hypothetical protein
LFFAIVFDPDVIRSVDPEGLNPDPSRILWTKLAATPPPSTKKIMKDIF